MPTTRPLRNGRSQAVRLPEAFRIEGVTSAKCSSSATENRFFPVPESGRRSNGCLPRPANSRPGARLRPT